MLMQTDHLLSHGEAFQRDRYTVLSHAKYWPLVTSCREYLQSCRDWVKGDASVTSWRESGEELPEAIISRIPLSEVTLITGLQTGRHAAWFNVYEEGQFIPAHKDVSGDVQLLICIDAPPEDTGGHLWLKKQSNVLALAPGDILIFEAAKLVHGTTPVGSNTGHSRVTLNVRIWAAA